MLEEIATAVIRSGGADDARWLDWLQDRPFAKDAGWLPLVAIKERLAIGQVLIIEKNGAPAGYVIAANRRDKITHVTQVVIDEECWREGLGVQLMQKVLRTADAAGSRSLTLRCAHDSYADSFWPVVGLARIASQAGQRRWLTCWSRAVGSAGRLSMPPKSRRPMRFGQLPQPT